MSCVILPCSYEDLDLTMDKKHHARKDNTSYDNLTVPGRLYQSRASLNSPKAGLNTRNRLIEYISGLSYSLEDVFTELDINFVFIRANRVSKRENEI